MSSRRAQRVGRFRPFKYRAEFGESSLRGRSHLNLDDICAEQRGYFDRGRTKESEIDSMKSNS